MKQIQCTHDRCVLVRPSIDGRVLLHIFAVCKDCHSIFEDTEPYLKNIFENIQEDNVDMQKINQYYPNLAFYILDQFPIIKKDYAGHVVDYKNSMTSTESDELYEYP